MTQPDHPTSPPSITPIIEWPALVFDLSRSSYWCMPQGDRSPAEKAQFLWMLENVNSLYLGCCVLILLDLSYLSRFW